MSIFKPGTATVENPPMNNGTNCQLNVTVTNGQGATVQIISDLVGSFPGVETPANSGRFAVNINAGGGTGASVVITKNGYQTINHRLVFAPNTIPEPGIPWPSIPTSGAWELQSESLVASFPVNPPTRDQVCNLQLTFQGLPVTISSGPYAGVYPCWFEPALQCLPDLISRQEVYSAKKSQGDTHQIVEFFTNNTSIYDEPGQPFQIFTPVVGEFNQAGFVALVIEVIQNGFTPVVVYDGDDGDNPMGYPNALRQLPILDSLFKSTIYGDIRPFILFARFWDGVFYGSSPANIQSFGQSFRVLNPNGYLAIEFNSGHIPVGNGPADYLPGGMMQDYDTICAEFQNWPTTGDQTWQICGRMMQVYNRPPDQPSDDDPDPPKYTVVPNPRGIWYFIRFEWGAYPGVRGQLSPQDFINGRNYYKALGPGSVC